MSEYISDISLVLKMVKLNTPFGTVFMIMNETTGEEELISTQIYFLIVITSSNLIISLFCLLYIILKLTLNKVVDRDDNPWTCLLLDMDLHSAQGIPGRNFSAPKQHFR